MTDLLLYFALAALASCVVCAALFWLKRPEKVEAQPDFPLFASVVLEQELIRVMGINEDTRPLPAHEEIDSFDYDELWEASENMHRYTVDWERMAQEQRRNANSDKWLNQALEDAGEDYEL